MPTKNRAPHVGKAPSFARRGRPPQTFPAMPTLVPEGKLGRAEVVHFTVSEMEARLHNINCHGQPIQAGTYARLEVGGTLVMSDTTFERNTNLDVVWNAHGHVFIAGLGLGMILHPILRKPEVKTVTVVEREQDVIDLIGPTLPEPVGTGRLNLICRDIFKYRPAGVTAGVAPKYGTIYFDIWSELCCEDLKEHATLKRRFARALDRHNDPAAWMGCWASGPLKARERRGGW